MLEKINLSNVCLFDIEGNGLYDTISKVHCIVADPNASGDLVYFDGDRLDEGISFLKRFDWLVAHNGIDYDIPVLVKLGYLDKRLPCFDTLVVSRLMYPDRPGGHSLRAWGKRLGLYKRDLAESEDEAVWDTYTPEMLEYCKQDVKVLNRLYHHLLKELHATITK